LIKTPVIDIVGALFWELSPPKRPVATRSCGSEIIIGNFCATERYEQPLVDDFTLTVYSATKRTRNQTALSKLVEYRSSHRLLYQLRKLVIYSKLFRSLQNEQAYCVFSVFLNQWRNWRFRSGAEI